MKPEKKKAGKRPPKKTAATAVSPRGEGVVEDRVPPGASPVPKPENALSARAKAAKEFVDHHSIDELLTGLAEVVASPINFRFGYHKHHYFNQLRRALETSYSMLSMLVHQKPSREEGICEGHEWASDTLARHFANAMGVIDAEQNLLPSKRLWVSYHRLRGRSREQFFHRFVKCCLNAAGHWERPPGVRHLHEILRERPEREYLRDPESGKMIPEVTQEEYASMSISRWSGENRFVSLTDEQFAQAWDLGIKDVRKLEPLFPDKTLGLYDNIFRHNAYLIEKGPLPIKLVIYRNEGMLSAMYAEEGQELESLSLVMTRLRKIARAMFAQPSQGMRKETSDS